MAARSPRMRFRQHSRSKPYSRRSAAAPASQATSDRRPDRRSPPNVAVPMAASSPVLLHRDGGPLQHRVPSSGNPCSPLFCGTQLRPYNLGASASRSPSRRHRRKHLSPIRSPFAAGCLASPKHPPIQPLCTRPSRKSLLPLNSTLQATARPRLQGPGHIG